MADAVIPLMLLIGLSLGLGAGFVMHRSNYCVAGMFRDLFLFRSLLKLRTLWLLVVISMVLFEAAAQLALLPSYPFPLIGSASLANLIGGFFFGVGMVLAGGCVAGTLYKMGAGSTLSAVAFVGLIAGSALYAEFHPWWVSVVAATTVFQGKVTVAEILGITPLPLVIAVTLVSSYYFRRWHRQGGWTRASLTPGSLQPWKAALLLCLTGLTSYLLIGMPLGITTGFAKIAGYLESVICSTHLLGLAYFKTLPLDYRLPMSGRRLLGGPGPQLDAIALIQLPVIIGIVLGGTLSAGLLKEFRLQVKLPWRQYLSAAAGGVVMGLASRMASGCNIWHLLGGLPILAAQSVLFLAGLLPGAWIGSLLVSRVVIR